MSRSYKKIPCVKDKNNGMKRHANKKVRRTKDVKSNAFYKRIVEQYDICDWKFREQFNRYLQSSIYFNEKYGKEQTEKEIYAEWYRSYKRK